MFVGRVDNLYVVFYINCMDKRRSPVKPGKIIKKDPGQAGVKKVVAANAAVKCSCQVPRRLVNHDFAVRVEGCPLAEKFLTVVEACGVVFVE